MYMDMFGKLYSWYFCILEYILYPLLQWNMKPPQIDKLLSYIVFNFVNRSHDMIQYITCDWHINFPTYGIQSFKLHLKKIIF